MALAKLVVLAALAVLAACAGGGSSPAATDTEVARDNRLVVQRTLDGGPNRIAVIGDSLATGFAARTKMNGFPQILLSKWSAEAPTQLDVFARGGLTTASALQALQAGEYGSNYSLILVELSTNDWRLDDATFAAQYSLLLDELKMTSPTATVVCLGGWGASDAVDRLDGVIDVSCSSHASKFLRLKGLAMDPSSKGPPGFRVDGGTSDGFHPNTLGHQRIADLVAQNVLLQN